VVSQLNGILQPSSGIVQRHPNQTPASCDRSLSSIRLVFSPPDLDMTVSASQICAHREDLWRSAAVTAADLTLINFCEVLEEASRSGLF